MRVTHRYSASADQIYDAWLDPKKAEKFLFATATGVMVRMEIDPRVGGRFEIVERRDGEDVLHRGTYVELVRARRIVFDLVVPKYSTAASRIEIDIAPLAHGCELTLSQVMAAGFESMEEIAAEGWRAILAVLEVISPDAEPSCGRGLAHHARGPALMAEVLGALSETLELHRAMLVLEDERSRAEDAVYGSLARAFGEIASQLGRASAEMAAQRELPMGAHDDSKWGPAHLASFTRFVRAQSSLALILRVASEGDEKMLASMSAS